MTSSYIPDPSASPVPPLSIAILSQRDLEVQIPIDKVVEPGISLSTACFSNNAYDQSDAQKCLSNLLAVGYRRIGFDVYWDRVGRRWSLCPFESSSPSTSKRRLSRGLESHLSSRQASSNQTNCSGSIGIDTVSSIIADYLQTTSTNLGARTTILTLAVNAAAPSNGSGVVLDSSSLPNSNEALSSLLSGLSNDLYTPTSLVSQRQDLNTSWLGNSQSPTPALAYLNTTVNAQGDLTTSNGWPNVGLTTFQKRLLIGLGPISGAMRNYNTTGDLLVFHNASSMTNPQSVSFNSSGISQGCLFNAESTDQALSTQWPIDINTMVPSQQSSLSSIPALSNLTFCGISPFLNDTSGGTAQISINTHLSVIQSAIWSWAANEPRNLTSSEASSNKYRCAVQDISLSGKWRVTNCDEQHFAACRSNSNPLQWQFSSDKGAYTTRESSCPGGSTFAAPRTALENHYLANAFSQFKASSPSNDDVANEPGPWVDFNALDKQECWVIGASTTCPYNSGGGTKRQVVIPIVAAVIVLVIAALLVFFKCAANRRNIRRGRRRRGKEDLGDYEGLPS